MAVPDPTIPFPEEFRQQLFDAARFSNKFSFGLARLDDILSSPRVRTFTVKPQATFTTASTSRDTLHGAGADLVCYVDDPIEGTTLYTTMGETLCAAMQRDLDEKVTRLFTEAMMAKAPPIIPPEQFVPRGEDVVGNRHARRKAEAKARWRS